MIAEKLRAITVVGTANTRLKDYLDLRLLLTQDVQQDPLARAITDKFSRRGTQVPGELPMGLTEGFSLDRSRQVLWSAFLRKNALPLTALADCVRQLREQLMPVLQAARRLAKYAAPWPGRLP